MYFDEAMSDDIDVIERNSHKNTRRDENMRCKRREGKLIIYNKPYSGFESEKMAQNCRELCPTKSKTKYLQINSYNWIY